ncbi:MAG: peptidyl-prolyl cis-trans isomerase [Butyrivibrio sp.]|nr:peptidyl-prolyl cis-trans isomerase [Butyrivibrio sp.]
MKKKLRLGHYIISYFRLCRLAGALLSLALLCGCAAPDFDRKVVFTTGFGDGEVFRIEDSTCSLTEIMVYLVNTQDGYETYIGRDVWKKETDTGTIETRLKESVLAKVAQIKAMNLLAQENNISLSDAEISLAQQAADEYYSTLSDADIAAMNNVTLDEIAKIYEEQALAGKLYKYIIRDINPEISDDEARTITVEQILLKTYSLNAQGERVDFSDAKKREVYAKARSILTSLSEDNSFEELMSEYNEADESTISFGKGEKEEVYENAAFNLGTEEVSGVIDTNDGYVILKCITTFNKEETEANKIKIVAQRKREVFGTQYDTFVSTLTKELNQKLWDSITLVDDENVTTSQLIEIYDKYFDA